MNSEGSHSSLQPDYRLGQPDSMALRWERADFSLQTGCQTVGIAAELVLFSAHCHRIEHQSASLASPDWFQSVSWRDGMKESSHGPSGRASAGHTASVSFVQDSPFIFLINFILYLLAI